MYTYDADSVKPGNVLFYSNKLLKGMTIKINEIYIKIENLLKCQVFFGARLLCFRHLSESRFCFELYTEEVHLQILS